jgi:threonine dehydrogenase-like Zn-dependent dehydrogenase
VALPNTAAQFPCELGYCAAGVVSQLGQDVNDFEVGDHVSCFSLGHRQVGNVSTRWIVKAPVDMPFSVATFVGMGQICLQGVRKARIELGEGVLILGLGLVGLLALQLSRLSGALPLIAVGRHPRRLEIARNIGADVVLDARDLSWLGNLPELAVIIESTGSPEAVSLALQAVGHSGRVCLLGSSRGDSVVNFYRDVHRKGVTMLGAHAVTTVPQSDSTSGAWTWKRDADCFMRLLELRKVDVESLSYQVIGWRDAQELYRGIIDKTWDNVATVLNWDES